MAQSLDTSFILERSIQQFVKFIFLSFILALALTRKLLPGLLLSNSPIDMPRTAPLRIYDVCIKH